MNIQQMKYFLSAAECLNFTEAAEKNRVSQPSLSKNITAMEEELGFKLFSRNSRAVYLTSAGEMFYEDIKQIISNYNLAVAKARNISRGVPKDLNIGVLDGTRVSDLLPKIIEYFEEYYPNVNIVLKNYSFGSLIKGLYDGSLDLIFTLKFDLYDRDKIEYEVLEKTKDHLVVHKDHPLAEKDNLTLADFADELFIMVNTEDSQKSQKQIFAAFDKAGIMPKIKYAPSIQTEMLWVQSGVGVCFLDSRNMLAKNNEVKFLNVTGLGDPSLSVAWCVDNTNSLRPIFKDLLVYEINGEITE